MAGGRGEGSPIKYAQLALGKREAAIHHQEGNSVEYMEVRH